MSVFLCVFFFFLYLCLVCGTTLVLITWTINRSRVAEGDPEWSSHGSTLLTLLLWWPVPLVSSKISWGSRNPSTPVNVDQLDQKRYMPIGRMPGLLPFSKSNFEIISFAIRYQLLQDVQKRNYMDPLLMLKRVDITRSFFKQWLEGGTDRWPACEVSVGNWQSCDRMWSQIFAILVCATLKSVKRKNKEFGGKHDK